MGTIIYQDLTKQDIIEFNQLLTVLNKYAEAGINEVTEKWIINVLDRSLKFFTHLTNEYNFETIERITVNRRVLGKNKRISDVKYLKYPPADLVKSYGRCNLPNQSIFYGSPIIMTALSEMKPRVGDLITKSIWKKIDEEPLKLSPIFHFQPTNGTINPRTHKLEREFFKLLKRDFPEELHNPVTNLSKFIAFHFSRFINPKKNKDYLLSAYFSNKILNEFENGTIEGILYPSVQSHLSFENIALKPEVLDNRFKIIEVRESIVFKDPSDNEKGYGMDGLSDCKDFNYDTGKINWSQSIFQPQKTIDFYKKHFDLEF